MLSRRDLLSSSAVGSLALWQLLAHENLLGAAQKPELNGGVTRMKFMRNGRVIWVDVDGQGKIIRRSRDK